MHHHQMIQTYSTYVEISKTQPHRLYQSINCHVVLSASDFDDPLHSGGAAGLAGRLTTCCHYPDAGSDGLSVVFLAHWSTKDTTS